MNSLIPNTESRIPIPELQALIDTLASLLVRPRCLSPQTERHFDARPEGEGPTLESMMADPDACLEPYEAETLFGPTLAPPLEERARVSPDLARTPVLPNEVAGIAQALLERNLTCSVELPDGRQATLKLTRPLVDRYLRLQMIDAAPAPEVAAGILQALPGPLAETALALARERRLRGPGRAAGYAALVVRLAARCALDEESLRVFTELVSNGRDLSTAGIAAGLKAEIERVEQAIRVAAGGRDYLSPTADGRRGDTSTSGEEGRLTTLTRKRQVLDVLAAAWEG